MKDVVPLRDHLITTLASPGDTFWIALDSAGRARQAGRSPVPRLAEATPMIRQGFSTVAGDGRTWATIFPFGNPFVVYDGTEVRCQGRLVEGEPFPRETPGDVRDITWAVASVLTDSSLFVLAGDGPEAARPGRILGPRLPLPAHRRPAAEGRRHGLRRRHLLLHHGRARALHPRRAIAVAVAPARAIRIQFAASHRIPGIPPKPGAALRRRSGGSNLTRRG